MNYNLFLKLRKVHSLMLLKEDISEKLLLLHSNVLIIINSIIFICPEEIFTSDH